MPRISFILVVTTSRATASIKPSPRLIIYHGSGLGRFLAHCLRPASWSYNAFWALSPPPLRSVLQHSTPEHWSTGTLCKSLNDIDGGWNLVNPMKAGVVHCGSFFCGSKAFIQSSGYQDRMASCSTAWTCNPGFVQVADQTRGHGSWQGRWGFHFICCLVVWGDDSQSAAVQALLYLLSCLLERPCPLPYSDNIE